MAIVCDKCGQPGGVRKRQCPYLIAFADGGKVHYCIPPALCAACYRDLGGLHGIHGERCREGAARAQEREDQRMERLASGAFEVRVAWGDWHEAVPVGMTGVVFRGLGGDVARLIPAASYDPSAKRWLDEYPDAQVWENYSGEASKRVF